MGDGRSLSHVSTGVQSTQRMVPSESHPFLSVHLPTRVLSSQHHCRNCGKSVCTQCSTKRAPLPEFGIKQPTRVCDICYKSVGPTGSSDATSGTSSSSKGGGDALGGNSNLPEEYLRSSLAKEPQVPATGHTEEMKMQEEDDLQLAIAMSLNEQDNKVQSTSVYEDNCT